MTEEQPVKNAERNARDRTLSSIVDQAEYEVFAVAGFNDGNLKEIIHQNFELEHLVFPWPTSHEAQIIPGWFLKRMINSGFESTMMNLHVPSPTKTGEEDPDDGETKGKETKKDVDADGKKTTEDALTEKQEKEAAQAVHDALKAELKVRGLAARGKTPVLQERLNDAIKREEAKEADRIAKEQAEVVDVVAKAEEKARKIIGAAKEQAEAIAEEQAEKNEKEAREKAELEQVEGAAEKRQPFDGEETVELGGSPPEEEGSDTAG